MYRQFRWLMVLILLLGLATLACNALTGGNNEGGAEGGGTTDLAGDAGNSGDAGGGSEGQAGEVADGPQTLDFAGIMDGLSDANSYRLRMEMRVEAPNETGAVQVINMSMETATVVEPPAFQSDIQIEGDEAFAEFGNLQLIQIGDTSYSTVPGLGCISGSAADLGTDLNPFADLLESGELLGDVNGARRVLPDETINNVAVYHFVFDESDISDPNNELQTVDGHIYIAKEEGYLVRLVMDGVGQIDFFDTGQTSESNMHVELNTFDVDQPITIEAPADCSSFDFEIPDLGLDTDPAEAPYPVFAGAQDLFTLDDLMSYQLEGSFADVLAFYQSEMPAAGFTPESAGDLITDTVAVLNFSRDGVQYAVTISESEGTVSVLVTTQ